MGESAFVNQTPRRSSRQPNWLNSLGLDYILIAATTALVLFGLLMVYSASTLPSSLKNVASDYFLQRQAIWALLGVLTILIVLLVGHNFFKRVSVLMLAVALIALITVEFLGITTLGADRSMWGASIRPSELAKLVIIIYVAVWLDAKREVLNNITLGLIPLGMILALTGGLIFIQPDISAGLTIVFLGGLLFFLAGGEWRQIGLVVLLTLVAGWVLINVYSVAMNRVIDYTAGLQDPTKASEHIRHSFQAVISGGFFGSGIGQSSGKFVGLPVAHTDSIFAVIAEETGLVGIFFLIFAYLVILWRGLVIAYNAADPFGRLLAAGITFWLLTEAFINIGVMVNLLPNAGNALPFISYGGSSMLVSMAGIGILLSINRGARKKVQEGENTFGSVVDLRWRDGRRRVSRTGRSSSTL